MTEPALVIIPHPDDCELTCAGTAAVWAQEGIPIVLVVATDGARGGKYRDAEPETVVRERHAEQEQAATLLGFQNVVWLGFGDGELENDRTLRAALVEQVRRLRPNRVITLDPTTVIFGNYYVNHRDHRALGMAVLDALYPEASNAGYYSEQLSRGLEPHKVPEVWLANSNEPNHWVDITNTIDLRFRALRCHASQMRLWPDNGEAVIGQQIALMRAAGLEHGMKYAEAFRRVVVNPLS